MRLDRIEKRQQVQARLLVETAKRIAGRLGLTAVPQDRFLDGSCPAVMQIKLNPRYLFRQADTPEWWCPPFPTCCQKIWPMIRKSLTQIVQQQVGERMNALERRVSVRDPHDHMARRILVPAATQPVMTT